MDAPKSRRRPFQYTLRTLLIVTALVAIFASVFGAKFRQAHRQRGAVKAVAAKVDTAALRYDWQWEYVPVRGSQRIPRGPLWLRDLLGNDYFDDVVYVDVRGPQVDDALAAELLGFPRLRFASLTGGPLTDAGLGSVARLRQLEVLRLDETQVTDAGLRRLAGLKELKTLSLEDTQLTDEALAELEGLAQLEKLNVNGTRVTREGVARFRRAMPRCEVFLLNPFPATEP